MLCSLDGAVVSTCQQMCNRCSTHHVNSVLLVVCSVLVLWSGFRRCFLMQVLEVVSLPSALSPQMHQSPPHQFLHLPRYPARS